MFNTWWHLRATCLQLTCPQPGAAYVNRLAAAVDIVDAGLTAFKSNQATAARELEAQQAALEEVCTE